MRDLNPPLKLGDIRVDKEHALTYLVIQQLSKTLPHTQELKRLYLKKQLDIGNLYSPSVEDMFICNIHEALISIGHKALKHARTD